MLNKIVFFLVLLVGTNAAAQELNANVVVNADRIQQSNKQVFSTLQNAIRDFFNNNKFTNYNVKRSELIDCNVLLVVNSYDPNTNAFTGTLQIQSSRPVFNSSYGTTLFNFSDKFITFNYLEFEPLVYSENAISSNLVGLLTYYANLIIGLDADSFSLYGGTANYQKASNVVAMLQQTEDKGWTMGEQNNRYALINDLLSNLYAPYREALYEYHIKGLDIMAENPEQGKKGIANAINILANTHKTRPNALTTRIFFDAKADEITKVFGAGPTFDTTQLIETLTRINSTNGTKWNRM
ncbi:DUF4835 family protein [Flavobacterium sp. CBA20B-1]|uniref:type IX secretion system protein PorD n=1 Tax=unclassified Flavobacterium TaxID=196869 RepID=UPI0022250F3E|nr:MULTISPECIES: DUF4835 family protein [unclassified Flavobacterium]WCM41995.1 DUF4835 family protein [Flavobacterium sp. CBA20B-1]